MASEVLSGGLGEIRAISTNAGGTALTAGTPVFIPISYKNAHHIFITPRNFATAVVVDFALNPYLVILKTADAMLTAPTDYSWNAQDASASTLVTFSSLAQWATGGACLLIGTHIPIRGFRVTIVDVNAAAGSLLQIWDWEAGAWHNLDHDNHGFHDVTVSGGITLAQSGLVYWTPSGAETTASLYTIYYSAATMANGTGTGTWHPISPLATGFNAPTATSTATVTAAGTFTVTLPITATGTARSGTATVTGSPQALVAGANTVDTGTTTGTFFIEYRSAPPVVPYLNEVMYWYQVRIATADVDNACTASSLLAANQSTAYGELISGQTFEEKIHVGVGGFGCIEADCDAGTANVIVNVAAANGGRLS
jgi:hypothetical protein